MRYFIAATLFIVGAIHLLPLVGVLGAAQLASLYGVAVADANTEILLRHRAVLFGIVGSFLILSAFRPSMQMLAFAMGFTSVLSFLWLAWSVGNANALVSRVVLVDWAALVLLIAGAVAWVLSRQRELAMSVVTLG